MYEFGQGVSQDDTKAAAWYLRAAEQGMVDAQAKLAEMYEEGRGVPKDLKEAERWRFESVN
jgi:TPR repeat protein